MGAAYGPYREPAAHDRAWHWVAAVDPDLALLQETNAPDWVRQRWTLHDEAHEFWASAIVTRPGLDLRPVAFDPASVLGRFGSYLATAELVLADGTALLVASVHTRATVASARGTHGLDRAAIARPSVGEPWWNDVAFAGYRELVEGRPFLVGGDWNTSRWCDADGNPTPSGADFFARAEAAGWRELSLDGDGHEGRTWYGSTNPRPHQPDHVFADPATAATASDFAIEPWPVTALGLSDHAPLLLEIDVRVATADEDATID